MYESITFNGVIYTIKGYGEHPLLNSAELPGVFGIALAEFDWANLTDCFLIWAQGAIFIMFAFDIVPKFCGHKTGSGWAQIGHGEPNEPEFEI